MNSERAKQFGKAMHLLDAGRAQDALGIGKCLLSSKDESYKLAGHLCVGLVYEEGGDDLARDIDKAIFHYHHAASIAQDPISFSYLARATMKKGVCEYPAALRYLVEGANLGEPPEVLLGFAQYYRTKPEKDLILAKKYYLRAALRGRFAGFFGYSSTCRELGQKGRALAMDVVRLIVGPFLALLFGRAAQDRF